MSKSDSTVCCRCCSTRVKGKFSQMFSDVRPYVVIQWGNNSFPNCSPYIMTPPPPSQLLPNLTLSESDVFCVIGMRWLPPPPGTATARFFLVHPLSIRKKVIILFILLPPLTNIRARVLIISYFSWRRKEIKLPNKSKLFFVLSSISCSTEQVETDLTRFLGDVRNKRSKRRIGIKPTSKNFRSTFRDLVGCTNMHRRSSFSTKG